MSDNKKTFIDKVKALLSENKSEKFADFKDKEGRIFRADALEKGNTIQEMAEDGKLVDVENGEYEFADNNVKITVDSSSITELVEIENSEMDDQTTQEFIDTKLEDGTMVRIDRIEEGGTVLIVDDAGETEPAPAGEHILEDGIVLTVGEGGVIESIKEPEADDSADEEMEDEKFEAKLEKWFTSKLESEVFTEFVKEISETMEKANSVISKFDEMEKENKELKEKFKKFSKEASAESVTSDKINFAEASREDKLKFLSRR